MKITPADEPTHTKYSRDVQIACECGRQFRLKAISDEPLPDRLPDADVTAYLRSIGWRLDSYGLDVCPDCVEMAELL